MNQLEQNIWQDKTAFIYISLKNNGFNKDRTKLIYCPKPLYDDVFTTNLAKYNDSPFEEYHVFSMKRYYENYLHYLEQNSLNNIKGYLENICDYLKFKLDELYRLVQDIDFKTDDYCYEGLMESYNLYSQEQIALDFAAKEYDQLMELNTLSLYEEIYYEDHKKEFRKVYPNIRQEFVNYCKKEKYQQLQNQLDDFLTDLKNKNNNSELITKVEELQAIIFEKFSKFNKDEIYEYEDKIKILLESTN